MARPASRIEQILRRYACWLCGALPGQQCTSGTGRRTSAHDPRYQLAREAGDLPIRDGT